LSRGFAPFFRYFNFFSVMREICLIEDDTVTRKLFVLLLDRAGFATRDFDNGGAALEWLARHQAEAVLTNIVLPEGASGIDVLQSVRAHDGDGKATRTLVFALTSFARQGEAERYLAMGFDGCIAKPIEPQQFGDRLRTLIETARLGA
jgi:CheY-like chemotaxis protein